MRRFVFLILVLVLAVEVPVWGAVFDGSSKRIAPLDAEDTARVALLREGFVLESEEGYVQRKGLKWYFRPDENITDKRALVKAGTAIELLESGMLDKLSELGRKLERSAKAKRGKAAGKYDKSVKIGVRLWGRVTRYKGKNYLYCVYFIAAQEEEDEQASEENGDGKDDSTKATLIPEDIMKKLKPKREVNLARMRATLDKKGDVIMANRSGFVKLNGKEKVFQVDGFGRNVSDMRFNLLECSKLQEIESNLAATPFRQRYKVSGIVTKYGNDYYLLLQRAVRTYSHGNFSM
jgi:hypothetical protein